MPKRTLTALLPDGTPATRATNHDYKFIVAVKVVPESYWGKNAIEHGWTLWGAYRWTTRRDLAEKCANECRKAIGPGIYGFSEVTILNVQS